MEGWQVDQNKRKTNIFSLLLHFDSLFARYTQIFTSNQNGFLFTVISLYRYASSVVKDMASGWMQVAAAGNWQADIIAVDSPTVATN